MRVIIGGGYTGGHIHCALAIAEALRGGYFRMKTAYLRSLPVP